MRRLPVNACVPHSVGNSAGPCGITSTSPFIQLAQSCFCYRDGSSSDSGDDRRSKHKRSSKKSRCVVGHPAALNSVLIKGLARPLNLAVSLEDDRFHNSFI